MKNKTLANCTPTEFVAQTVKIKKQAEKWLTLTKILEIKAVQPEYKTLEKDAPAEERAEVIKHNAKLLRDQSMKNMSKIFDACFEDHPKETLELLALCCFVEPEKVDENPISFYIKAINDLISDESVLSFFTSLAVLGQTNTPRA